MDRALKLIQRLIEADPDSPESFDVQGHLDSPVARLASTNGFTRLDRHEGEERWVKKLSNGKEAWLRTTSNREFERPMDMRDPQHSGGREWEFLEVGPDNDYRQLARANEVVMSYLLGAILQRLATWPAGVPKPKLK